MSLEVVMSDQARDLTQRFANLKPGYPYYLAGRAEQPNTALPVYDKYTGQVATHVAQADAEALDAAIAQADRARTPMQQMAPYQRQAILQQLVAACEDRSSELAESLCIEAGKPLRYARGEVTRLIDTLRIAGEEAVRLYGEVMPMAISPRAAGRRGFWQRVPVGVCSFVTPWNFPLNLVAHKIAPALACGCPFILKPASATPIGALILGELLAQTDLPEGAFSILPMPAGEAGALTDDPRIAKFSFTGSAEVGWRLKHRAYKKRVTLELGGDAAVIVHEDADIDDAVQRVLFGAFYQSGQSCISVQRIYVHRPIYETFRDRLIEQTRQLALGDPMDEATFIGPVISEAEAKRLTNWIDEAVETGARCLCGHERDKQMLAPTLLEQVPATVTLAKEEAFGPVAWLAAYDDFDEALAQVNTSQYGLQAGVFTRDWYRMQQAWDHLAVGGVLINDVPSWRVDHMPYGGVKESGEGREGIRFAIESMTEYRLLVIREPGQ
jgi:acyl-CoA reductase-like NAD-dependent aldehyde dehydrogenase